MERKGRATGTGAAITIILILAAALFSCRVKAEGLNLESAQEFKFEIGGGFTKYHPREDGTWWQSNPQLKTDNNFKSFGYQIGMRWPNVRLAFVNLGHFYGDNNFVGDDAKDRYPFQCPLHWDECQYNAKISGNAYGLSLGPVVEKKIHGFTVGAEGGVFVYRSNQKTFVTPLEGQNIEAFSYNRMWGVHRTWYLGAAIGRGPWSLNYRVYNDIFEQGDTSGGKGGDAGMTGGPTQTLFVTYAFN